MAIAPTLFSRVSTGFITSTLSIVDADPADSGAVFSCVGGAVFDDTVTITGALTQTGAVTLASTLSVGGAITASSALSTAGALTADGNTTLNGTVVIGAGETALVAISSETVQIDFASVPPLDSITVDSRVTAANIGDIVLIGDPATHAFDLVAQGIVTSDGTVTIGLTNSTLTAIDPADLPYRIQVMRYSTFT